jgi:hypothetical protein
VRVTGPENVLTWGSHTFVKKMLLKYKKIFGGEVPENEVHAPLEPGDHPGLDESRLCTPKEKRSYMSMIGDLQLEVSLGRIDIYAATLTLSVFCAAPHIGHLERTKRVYRYIRNYKKISIKFRTGKCDHSAYNYIKPNFGYVYHPCKEDIPDDAPTPKGNSIQMTNFLMPIFYLTTLQESLLLVLYISMTKSLLTGILPRIILLSVLHILLN